MERSEEEMRMVLRALERSKEILNYVNQAVREAEDQHRLADIQRKLDKTSFDKADHPMVAEFKVSHFCRTSSISNYSEGSDLKMNYLAALRHFINLCMVQHLSLTIPEFTCCLLNSTATHKIKTTCNFIAPNVRIAPV